MAIRFVRTVWKKHSDNVHYPYLGMEVAWPAFISTDNPNFLKTLHLIEEIVASKENAPPAANPATDSAMDRASGALLDLARYLELSSRHVLVDLLRDAAPAVSATGIEYPYIDNVATLQVLHSSYRFVVETSAYQEAHAFEREAAIRRLGQIKEFAKRRYPDEITLSCIHLARSRQIPCRRASEMLPVFVFGNGSQQKRLWQGFSGATSYLGVVTSTNKSLANEIMAFNGLPVPKQRTVVTVEAARNAADEIGFPVVVKPQNTDFGTAVETGIDNQEDLRLAFEAARRYGNVLVEEHIDGLDHRITVINGKAVRAYERAPARVAGDGIHTVSELIDQAAIERLKAIDLREYGFVKKDDPIMIGLLRRQNLALGDVPDQGRIVLLRTNANVSTGGTGRIVTDEAHPDNLKLAERAAAVLGLDIAGVDFICRDISVSWLESKTAICEVNPTPGMILPDDPKRILNYLTGDGESRLRTPIIFFFGSQEEIDESHTALIVLARSSGTTLTSVRSKAVFQNGRQISQACTALGQAIEIALSDNLTDSLLVCVDAGEMPDLSSCIDFADMAFMSGALDMASSEASPAVHSPAFSKVMRGDVNQFHKECLQLFRGLKSRNDPNARVSSDST